MTTDRAVEIIVEHTRFASEYAQTETPIDTEEKVQFFIARKEFYRKRIEELRARRIELINKQGVKQHG